MKRYKFTATVVNHSLEFDEPVETPKQDQKEQLLPKVQDEPLPIAKYRDKILKKIKDSFVTIISAGTGSGKVSKRYLSLSWLITQCISQSRQHKCRNTFSMTQSKEKNHAVSWSHNLEKLVASQLLSECRWNVEPNSVELSATKLDLRRKRTWMNKRAYFSAQPALYWRRYELFTGFAGFCSAFNFFYSSWLHRKTWMTTHT